MEIEKERTISLNLNRNVQCDYQPYAANDTNMLYRADHVRVRIASRLHGTELPLSSFC